MRKTLYIVIFAVLFLVACGSTTNSDTDTNGEANGDNDSNNGEKIVIKFGHIYDQKNPLHLSAEMFADIVNEETDGNVEIEIFPDSTIGSSRDLFEGMQIGTVDMAFVPTANVATFYKPLDLFYLPFIFRDKEHAYNVSDGDVGESLYEELKNETGVRTLGMYESGFRNITTKNTPVQSPEDLKGVKMRALDSPISIDTFNALGANTVAMPISEVFTALQQGTIDGQDSPISHAYASSYYEVQGHMTLSNHQWAGIMMLIGDETWNSLSDEYKKVIEEAAEESKNWQREELNNSLDEFLDIMKEEGLEVIDLTPEQREKFQEKTRSVWEEYEDHIGKDVIESVENTQ